VRAWDQDGHASDWTKPATWSMGLLESSDWKARWIGYDRPADSKPSGLDFDGAKWIWFAGDDKMQAPVEKRYFRKTFAVPAGVVVDAAELVATADDQFTFKINGKQVAQSDGETDAWRRPVFATVEKELKAGENVVEVEATNTSSGAAGLIAKLKVSTSDLSTITVTTDDAWLCGRDPKRISEKAGVVAAYGASPWGKLSGRNVVLPAPRFLRREFTNLD
jgi:alpha-L-rhamnosidase